MGVYIYCHCMSPIQVLKEHPFPEARLVTTFLLFASFPLLSQGWLSTQSRNFVSLIPSFCVSWHSWDSGREWCLHPIQDETMCWIPSAKELIFAANACFFFVADCTCEIVRLRNVTLWRQGVKMLHSNELHLCAFSVWVPLLALQGFSEGRVMPHLQWGPLYFSCN